MFGSFIIHILYIECAKIKKNNSGTKRLTQKRAILSRRNKNQVINKQGSLGRKILTCLVPVLLTFCIQCVLKLKKKNSGTKRLTQKRAILSRRNENQMINKQGSLGRKIKGQFITTFIVAHYYVCNIIPEHSGVFFPS